MSLTSAIDRFIAQQFPTQEEGLQWADRVANNAHLNPTDEIIAYNLLFNQNFLHESFASLDFKEQTKVATELVGDSLETSKKIKELLTRYLKNKNEVIFLTIDFKTVTFSRKETEFRNKYLIEFENILIPFKKSTLDLVKVHFQGSQIEITEENYDELLSFAEMFDCTDLQKLLGEFAFQKIADLHIHHGNLKYVNGIIYHPSKNYSILQIKGILWEYFTIDISKNPCEITLKERESFKILRQILVLFPRVTLKISNFTPDLNPLLRTILSEPHLIGLEVDLSKFKEVDLMYLANTLKKCPNITFIHFQNLPYIEFLPNLYLFNTQDVKLVEALFEKLSPLDQGISDLKERWDNNPPRSIEILKTFLPLITPELLRKSFDGTTLLSEGTTLLSEILDRFPSFVKPFYIGGYYLTSEDGLEINYNPIKYILIDERLAGALSYPFQKLIEEESNSPSVYLFRGAQRGMIIKFGYFLEKGCVEINDLREAQNLFKLAHEALVLDLMRICCRWILIYLGLHPSEENDLKIMKWAKEIKTKMFDNYFENKLLPELTLNESMK